MNQISTKVEHGSKKLTKNDITHPTKAYYLFVAVNYYLQKHTIKTDNYTYIFIFNIHIYFVKFHSEIQRLLSAWFITIIFDNFMNKNTHRMF